MIGTEIVFYHHFSNPYCINIYADYNRKMVGQLAAEPSLRPLLCMTTSGWDKLLFLNLPGVLVGKVSQLVETIWGIQDSKTYEKVSNQNQTLKIEGTVCEMLSDPQCKDGNARFTTVPLKVVSV